MKAMLYGIKVQLKIDIRSKTLYSGSVVKTKI